MTKHDKYLRVVNWARARYTKNNTLVISTGGMPSLYSRIEDAAFNKYLSCRNAAGVLVFPG